MHSKPSPWLLGICAGCIAIALLWIWIRHGDAIYYRWFELPAVRRTVIENPDIKLRGIQNFTAPGEPEELRVILRLTGKGDISLSRPFQSSFTTGGPLILMAIGECDTPVLGLDSNPIFSDLQLRTVRDIAESYDLIYARVRERGWCHSGYGMEPHEP